MTYGFNQVEKIAGTGTLVDLKDQRKPMMVNIEATGFFGDTTSLRRQRRRNRIRRLN
ncbi:hypothetical protein QGN29_03100 [Temperatibacter marinus]|uniref:Uncharacterized protein n=1 Tax=Temperatibacter marinus TaxID=1456591 RepID=A0AA52EIW6_9PROT|nr:hypothetical protein [Temperatibacter marinus]WND03357.1 hypothetical protein QGN29_03100 [Temperatibacter marinus]